MIEIDITKIFAKIKMSFGFNNKANRIVIFGPSGSGKSTLLKMMVGFLRPDSGRIIVNGRTIFDAVQGINIPVHFRRFAYLPQDYTLFPHLTVEENILYGLTVGNISFDRRKFVELVAHLGLLEKLAMFPAALSGGQQQRVALARIMMIQPCMLLLDEPFNALDLTTRKDLRDFVIELIDDEKIPALLVTHDLEEAMAFAEEIVIISAGQVIEYGKRAKIFHAPRYVETARLLGFQVLPLLPGTDQHVHTVCGEHLMCLFPQKQEDRVCIRPENIMLIRADQENKIRENVISGEVVSLHHRVRYVRITVHSEKGDYIVHVPNHVIGVMDMYQGKRITISLKSESLCLCTSRSGSC